MIPDKALNECIKCEHCFLDPDCCDIDEPQVHELICYHGDWLGDFKYITDIRTENKDNCPKVES